MFLGRGVSEVLFVRFENDLPFVAYLVNDIGSEGDLQLGI